MAFTQLFIYDKNKILAVHPLSQNASSPERNCCGPNPEDNRHETGRS